MVLGRTIKYDSSGIGYGSSLASGLDPTDIRAVETRTKKAMQRAGKMPMKASGQSVINAAKRASFMETQNDLINQQISHQERELNAGLANRDAAIKLAGVRMKAELKYQQQGQHLQELVLQHRLATGVVQAESVGTQQGYAKQSRFANL